MSLSSLARLAGHAHASTGVRTTRFTCNLSRKKLDFSITKVDEKISLPWFYLKDNCDRWRLELYPRGQCDRSGNGTQYVALYLTRDSPGKSPIIVEVEMQICTFKNRILRQVSTIYEYGPQQTHGYRQFVERLEFFRENFFGDTQFTITCTINILTEVITSTFNVPFFDSKISQLGDDFRSLFEDPVFTDFTVIVGNKKFPTHRNILAKRSPVFAAMFEHEDLEENRKKEVKIKNMKPDVIKGMLEFIYTDQVTNIKELASGLLEAANKYDLGKLRIMCEETLYNGLNKENAAELLLLADLHRADKLKGAVMKYIVKHASEVVKSNNWKKIGGNPELLLELFDQVVLPQAANS